MRFICNQPLHRAMLDGPDIGQRQQPTPNIAFQHRPGRQQSHHIARRGFDGDAMADPADIAGDVAPNAAASDHLVGPARKERLDHAAPPRQQAVRMFALRHALARNIVDRKRVTLQDGDSFVEIRQHASGQQAAHTRTDHDRMFADPFHDAPCLRRRRHSPHSADTVRRQDRFCCAGDSAITNLSVLLAAGAEGVCANATAKV
jgi:hypothetical protein